MSGEEERPRLRPVESFPVTVSGRRQVALRDPAGISERVMILTPETLFLASCLDGTQTLRDVQAACFRRFQEIVPIDLIGEVVASLDEALLLDNARFRRRRDEIESAFLASPVREAAHAGGAYSADPIELREILEGHLRTAAGASPSLPAGPLSGLIAPHIDPHRGGAGYGAAYHALRERAGGASLFVILGTAHSGPEEPYTATAKAYDSPLGRIDTDADFVHLIASRYGERLFREEGVHRVEHSIEFQAVLLRHLFPGRPIRIVPILCSSFHDLIESRRSPAADPRIEDFLGALREALASRAEACLVAAADLAHLGPRFGDPSPVSEEEAALCASLDRLSLDAAAAGDAESFYDGIARGNDERRVCGISAIYTFLRALPPGSRGTLLHYGQALDPERTTFVSFASMGFVAA